MVYVCISLTNKLTPGYRHIHSDETVSTWQRKCTVWRLKLDPYKSQINNQWGFPWIAGDGGSRLRQGMGSTYRAKGQAWTVVTTQHTGCRVTTKTLTFWFQSQQSLICIFDEECWNFPFFFNLHSHSFIFLLHAFPPAVPLKPLKRNLPHSWTLLMKLNFVVVVVVVL